MKEIEENPGPLLDLVPGDWITCFGRVERWLGSAIGTKGCFRATEAEIEEIKGK